MFRIHIVGRKNAGKTTLIVDLVREFAARGLRVGTIKHTHHHHELDTPGKDSHQHRMAGSHAVGILSPGMSAVFWPNSDVPAVVDRYEQFQALMHDCDLVLVEGDLQSTSPRLEVWRDSVEEPPYAKDVSGIVAVISDGNPAVGSVIWSRSDLPGLADKILTLAETSGT